MKWSENTTLQFVKIYLNHECLWNPHNIEYKIRSLREKAYNEMIIEFFDSTGKSITSAEIKTKIKNLRTTYSQQLNKILVKSNPDSIYEPSLIWFNEMDKHLKNIPMQKHHNYSQSHDTSELDLPGQDYTCDGDVNKNSEHNHDMLPAEDDLDLDTSELVKPVKKCKKKRNSSPNYDKKKKIKRRTSERDCSDNSIDSTKEDELDIFGKYIAAQLRHVSLRKALRLQLQIQNLVSEARMSDDDIIVS